MPPIPKRWQVSPRLSPEADRVLSEYPSILRQILYNRGYSAPETARQYLQALPPEGNNPFHLIGISSAVDRIDWALTHQEKIAIYGDYDADGVTATALLVQALRHLDAQVMGYIPNRFDEGYGLNNEALDNLKDAGITLIITVDCGVRSLIEAEHAREIGLDLIITDHHHPGKELPPALALINPKQTGDMYPDRDLAGVGLAFKLVSALFTYLKEKGNPISRELDVDDYLDLVAVGTIADLAPLVGENRTLVRAGLRTIHYPRRQGLLSLIGAAGLKADRITASDIGFMIGPRLNAAGRLDSALAAFDLLTTQDVDHAGQLAQQLDNQNQERQRITREIQIQAEQLALAENPEALLLFAAHEDFNPGVVGLAASRLCELYYRPTIIAHRGQTYTRGSCRSIREFHITEALDECSDLLEHHGGHAAAAGFTIRNENVDTFIDRLHIIVNERLSQKDLRPVLNAETDLPLRDLTPELSRLLELLQPTGYGNPEPLFVSRDLQVKNFRNVGRENAHLKLIISDGLLTFDAIAFRQGHWIQRMPRSVDMIYSFELNEFNGRESFQLNVRDLKPAGVPD